ncbi:MAG TPA: tetratricopeptide repeat protein [Prolixibacteraceae bacterium]|nr:tetratricopeptide repeat protein [Prolixibacteraceae bacterium]
MRHCFLKYYFWFLVLVPFLSGYTNRIENQSGKDTQIDSLLDKATRIVNVAANHDSVIILLNNADHLAKTLNNQHQSISILILKGLNEYYFSNYEEAVVLYFQALDLAEQSQDSILLAKTNLYLGIIYDEFEDYDGSIVYFQKSLEFSQSIHDSALIAKTFQNIAISYQNKKDLAKALDFNEKANNLAMLRKDTLMMIDIINNFGTIAYDQKKLDESLENYWKALNLYLKINYKQGIAIAYNNIGLVYLDKKEYRKSINYFKKSLDLATEYDMYDFTGDIYSNLTIYYKELKDYKNAYYYYDKYNIVYDSLVGEKKSKMIRQIHARYQLVKSSRELEELKNKNQLQSDAIDSAKSFQIYLVAITILVIVLMIVTFNLLFKEKKLARELKIKTGELHELNVSKDKFFSIIAHDLKNPFNVLVSYTSILKTDLELFSKEELKQIISDLNHASENGYDLLQNLLVWTRSQTNRIHVYKTNFFLVSIFEQVKALADLSLIAKEQQLLMEIEPDLIVYADKDMIATVLRNLVFNAAKFSPKSSKIHVKACLTGSNVKVDVIDSGVGIPEGNIEKLFVIDKNTSTQGTEGETGTGLGLVICREFVEKNNGLIWVESKLGEGSVFSFTLPIGSNLNKKA